MILSIAYNGSMRNHIENTIKYIPVERIALEDRFYSISPFCFNAEKLIRSIKIAGITTPIILEPLSSQSFRIVSGFRRVASGVEAGLEEIPAIIEKPACGLDRFWRTVQENWGSRDLHELEKAEIINKLKLLHGVDEESMLNRFLPQLGLGDSRHELERYLALAGLNSQLKKACFFGNLLPATALEIRSWPETEQDFLISLASALMLGTNKQKQVVRLIEDLKKKTRSSLESIWGAAGLGNIEQKDLNFDSVHGQLSALRYPVLSENLERFRKLRERVLPGQAIKLQAPRYFDGDRLTVSFSAADTSEFREKAQQLLKAAGNRELEDMFRLL